MNKKAKQNFLSLLSITLMVGLLTACSDDKPSAPTQTQSVAEAKPKVHKPNHVDQGEASDSVKNKFVNLFANNCVKRELKNSVNKDNDEQRAKPSCECIAKKIAEDLSDVDAEKYLQEHEDTQTLEIKFDHAAYFCLQNKPLPKGPHLFGKE